MAVSACANPVQKDVLKFQESATTLTTASRDIYNRHTVLVARTNLEAGVADYSDLEEDAFDFPAPPAQNAVDPKLWAARMQAMKGIADYATALAALNDPAADDKAVTGLAALGGGVNELSSVTNVSIPSPVIELAQTVTGAALRARSAGAIRSAISETQPVISDASRALKADFELLNMLMGEQREIYLSAARLNLEIARKDHRTSAAELQRAYREASTAQSDIDNLIMAYGASIKAIEDFDEAHEDLASSQDGDRALDEFLITSRAVADSVAALNE